MKKLSLIAVTAALALAIQSCGGNADSTEKADSLNDAKDTAVTTDVVRDTVTVTPAIEVTAEDAKFAVDAANGGMAEVDLGTLSKTKATNAKVKEFATMMVADHSKANDELKALAAKLNITLPATINDDAKKVKEELAKKSGADFDKAYVSAMVDDHKKDVKLFEEASKNNKSEDLKVFAAKTLPTLKHHLEMIQKIQDGLK